METNYEAQSNQIKVIIRKLKAASEKDSEREIFGTSSHQYKVNPPLSISELVQWQSEHGITLPSCYVQFLTEIGNGGAGPYYGMYTLTDATSYTEKEAMTAKCILYPNMDKEEWNKLIDPLINEEDISDCEYDAVSNKVLGGMLNIGTQGCEYEMYLVLEGEYKGKIVYTSSFYEDYPFFFVYEANFLDWYERWLEEIILDYDDAWFGSRMPGDEGRLIAVYEQTLSDTTRLQALEGMYKMKSLAPSTLNFLQGVANQPQPDLPLHREHQQQRYTAIRLMCKTSPEIAQPYLLQLLDSGKQEGGEEDYAQGLMMIHDYCKNIDLNVFVNPILQGFDYIHEPSTLRYAGYVLESVGKVSIHDFIRFLTHENPNIQTTAIYATRISQDKLDSLDMIEEMFRSGGEPMIEQTLLYWGAVPHIRLLPYYKRVWTKVKQNMRISESMQACLHTLDLPSDYFDEK